MNAQSSENPHSATESEEPCQSHSYGAYFDGDQGGSAGEVSHIDDIDTRRKRYQRDLRFVGL